MTPQTRSLDEARQFIRDVDISAPWTFRGPNPGSVASQVGVPGDTDANYAVVVGSQIAEFAAGIPVALRPHIWNSFLLAQLAARRAIAKTGGGFEEWFDAYLGVLTSVGWLQEGNATALHEVSSENLQAQKEVTAVITTALGPAAASASIVLAALNGLKSISMNSPWITIFDRQSQTRTAAQFQMTYARGDHTKKPQIALACFELSATTNVSQVLFFRNSSATATLRHRECRLSLNELIFNGLTRDIESKIAAHLAGMIAAIEI